MAVVLRLDGVSARSRSVARESVSVQGHELEGRLARLEQAVDRILGVMERMPAQSPSAPISREAPVDYRALAALHSLATTNPKGAQQSTVFLTAQEAIQRFGAPDEIGPANGSDFFWNYDGPSGGDSGGLMLVFRGGRVAFHELR